MGIVLLASGSSVPLRRPLVSTKISPIVPGVSKTNVEVKAI